MKKTALFCVGAVCLLSKAGAAEPAVLWDAARNQAVTAAEAAEALSVSDVVLLGEYHGRDAIHALEEDLFRALSLVNGEAQVLSLEMFERDVQQLLDGYLAGTVTKGDFLAGARPWPGYASDYRGLVEWARENRIPVVAANIPRRMAAVLAKTGSLDAVVESDRAWLPEHTWAPPGPYRDRFMAAMEAVAPHGMGEDPERREDLYRAQCLKDDTMAESIVRWIDAHPGARVLHVQGAFHGADRLGVAEKLHRLRPSLRVAVVTPVEEVPAGGADRADFWILLPTED